MADPSSYVTAKIASAIGGLLGGMSLMTFIRPRTIGEAFARGGVSTGGAIIFATPVLTTLNLPVNWEMQLMSGGIIGFLAYSVLGATARFLVKNQESDIVEMAHKVRGNEVKKTRRSRSGRGNRSRRT